MLAVMFIIFVPTFVVAFVGLSIYVARRMGRQRSEI
jgi:hypothetical protein